MPLEIIVEGEEYDVTVTIPSRPVARRHRSHHCSNCQQVTCRSCGHLHEAVTPTYRALPAPPNRLQLPAPPTPAPSSTFSRVHTLPSESGSRRSSHSRSGERRLSDAPLRPSDSASQIAGPRSQVSRQSYSTTSRSETSRHAERNDRPDGNWRTAVTVDNLRRSASASGPGGGRPLAITPPLPPPPRSPSRVSHSSSNPHGQRRIGWRDEPSSSRVSHNSASRSDSTMRPRRSQSSIASRDSTTEDRVQEYLEGVYVENPASRHSRDSYHGSNISPRSHSPARSHRSHSVAHSHYSRDGSTVSRSRHSHADFRDR